MNTSEMLGEIRELNLAYVTLAQHMIRQDRRAATDGLGISNEMADTLGSLTEAQASRIAGTSVLLCRLRFDDLLVLNLLTNHAKPEGMPRPAEDRSAVLG